MTGGSDSIGCLVTARELARHLTYHCGWKVLIIPGQGFDGWVVFWQLPRGMWNYTYCATEAEAISLAKKRLRKLVLI